MSFRSPAKLNPSYANVQTVAPASEPVTVAEVQAALNIGAIDDALIGDLITEAREEIERLTGFAMITQTWVMSLDAWPAGTTPWWSGVRDGSIADLYTNATPASVTLPVWPLQSVSGVNVYDEADAASAVTVSSVFYVDTQATPGRMVLRSGAVWPIALRSANAIEVTYIAGYGDDAADVPGPLKRAVRVLACYLYEHRGDGCDIGDAVQDSGAGAAIGRYKVVRI